MVRWSPRSTAGTRPLWITAAAGTAFATLAFAVAHHVTGLSRPDVALSLAAHRFADSHPAWLTAMAAATRAGDAAIVMPVAAVAVGLLAWKRLRHSAVVIAASLILIPLIRLGLSVAFHRPRPQDPLSAAHGWAFPSGHTTTAAVAALVAAYAVWPYTRRAWQRGAVVAGAAAWAITVAISRVALVVHWPSDVIGGLLLATALVALITWFTAAFGPPRGGPHTEQARRERDDRSSPTLQERASRSRNTVDPCQPTTSEKT
ncbi:undecaprenyl-diphosphatase [Allocatelliglobosispora scoriae]|uniref:Undecaprenyl-diphosphatase n=1 Tax=Allocatelliglobosispora scoriae TaxID=643052 RepID=A0A841C5A8_9ACTN|nr:phosphatase PAP2 family protein [Allocatelliglobosispora scoriae]MBB5874323.1 undecaprenyl-diphosphatase [Allocatelliglobosispora scoriae]